MVETPFGSWPYWKVVVKVASLLHSLPASFTQIEIWTSWFFFEHVFLQFYIYILLCKKTYVQYLNLNHCCCYFFSTSKTHPIHNPSCDVAWTTQRPNASGLAVKPCRSWGLFWCLPRWRNQSFRTNSTHCALNHVVFLDEFNEFSKLFWGSWMNLKYIPIFWKVQVFVVASDSAC